LNIDQYRALKAQEAEQATQATEQPPATAEEESTPPTQDQPSAGEEQADQPTKEQEPQTITIDGQEVPFDELKNGYLRQQDYTKKTQELSRKNKENEEALQLYTHLKSNPQLAKNLLQTKELPQELDPAQQKVQKLEEKMYDMMLAQEIDKLQNKYEDFEVREVLQVAHEKNTVNLEDAYHLFKSRKGESKNSKPEEVDKEKLKQELRKEVEEEIKGTKTAITTSDAGVVQQEEGPKITPQEQRVARKQKMTDAEYVKWRDGGK